MTSILASFPFSTLCVHIRCRYFPPYRDQLYPFASCHSYTLTATMNPGDVPASRTTTSTPSSATFATTASGTHATTEMAAVAHVRLPGVGGTHRNSGSLAQTRFFTPTESGATSQASTTSWPLSTRTASARSPTYWAKTQTTVS